MPWSVQSCGHRSGIWHLQLARCGWHLVLKNRNKIYGWVHWCTL